MVAARSQRGWLRVLTLLLVSACSTTSESYQYTLTQDASSASAIGRTWEPLGADWSAAAAWSMSSDSDWGEAAMNSGVDAATLDRVVVYGPYAADPDGLAVTAAASIEVALTTAIGADVDCADAEPIGSFEVHGGTAPALPANLVNPAELAALEPAVDVGSDIATGNLALCFHVAGTPPDLDFNGGVWLAFPWAMTVTVEGTGHPCPPDAWEQTGGVSCDDAP